MNKLIAAMIGLCTIVSLVGMEKEIIITAEESNSFAKHLKMAVIFGEKAITDNKLPKINPIHVMCNELEISLTTKYDNDIRKMISSDQELNRNIKLCLQVEKDPFIKFGLEQIRLNVGNVEEANKFTLRYRLLAAGFKLTEEYPEYSIAYMGEVQTSDRINYMLRNANYPMTDIAKKKFTSMFIYQILFAPKL